MLSNHQESRHILCSHCKNGRYLKLMYNTIRINTLFIFIYFFIYQSTSR